MAPRPQDCRAEVVSSYFVCCFIGNALPVIGVGIISAYASIPLASTMFAGMIVLFALGAFIFGRQYTSKGD